MQITKCEREKKDREKLFKIEFLWSLENAIQINSAELNELCDQEIDRSAVNWEYYAEK